MTTLIPIWEMPVEKLWVSLEVIEIYCSPNKSTTEIPHTQYTNSKGSDRFPHCNTGT